jgi:hypothetical protein
VALSDVLEAIQGSILDILKGAELGTCVMIYGDRARAKDFRPPIIWILPEDSAIEMSGMGEMWVFTFTLAVVVKDVDPKRGLRKATDMAADASATLVKTHTLGGKVRDVRRVRFLPGDPKGMDAEQLHAAGFAMEVRFRYLEQED